MSRDPELPGVEGEGVSPVAVKAIDDAFDALISARQKRMSWGEKEAEANASLVALFKKHRISVYTYDERKYKLVDIEKVKLAPKEPDEE